MANNRRARAKGRVSHLANLSKKFHKARRLFWTGAIPQSTYGMATCGMDDRQLQTIRAQADRCLGLPGGRCLSTAIAVVVEVAKDHMRWYHMNVLNAWCEVLDSLDPAGRLQVIRAWSAARRPILEAPRWKHAKGRCGTIVLLSMAR